MQLGIARQFNGNIIYFRLDWDKTITGDIKIKP